MKELTINKSSIDLYTKRVTPGTRSFFRIKRLENRFKILNELEEARKHWFNVGIISNLIKRCDPPPPPPPVKLRINTICVNTDGLSNSCSLCANAIYSYRPDGTARCGPGLTNNYCQNDNICKIVYQNGHYWSPYSGNWYRKLQKGQQCGGNRNGNRNACKHDCTPKCDGGRYKQTGRSSNRCLCD
ncbi:hypothetical protein T492DRAFT_146739 [Pavlovales sp. CCMP2436]|nr:hypothetical protein T492DRAFT_146739 [Pavlovales sp. CCMP2436]